MDFIKKNIDEMNKTNVYFYVCLYMIVFLIALCGKNDTEIMFLNLYLYISMSDWTFLKANVIMQKAWGTCSSLRNVHF